MKKHVILITVIILVCACAVGLVALAMNSDEPNEVAPDAGEVSDIVTDPTDEVTEPITDKPTESVTEPTTEAPTEPVTEAPTEPEPATEPETVPPTQPKVDFTYIARDTMLDGEQVEYYNGCSYPEYFSYDAADSADELFTLVLLQYRVSNCSPEVQLQNSTNGRLNVSIINTRTEYVEFCKIYYENAAAYSSSKYAELYNAYSEMPECSTYDEAFFENNNLIIMRVTKSYSFSAFVKNGAELCLGIQSHMRRLLPGYSKPGVMEQKVIRCFEISKDAMDGVDTISIYVENIEN